MIDLEDSVMTYPCTTPSPEVFCFGMITPARLLLVDSLPGWNTGAIWTEGAEFISDDAAIVAGLLVAWGVPTELAGTALGDDAAGRQTVQRLHEMGVIGTFDLRSDIRTPFEVNVSDSQGGRTYFWNRPPELLATMDQADISAVGRTQLLYVDWYDAPHITRAMTAAEELGIPVLLNLEHGHSEPESLAELIPHATICQAVTDAAQIGGNAESIARSLIAEGVETALVTMASEGVVGIRHDEELYVAAPDLDVVDTCGAGATFSAAYILRLLAGDDFERALRFAVAAASLKCTAVGLRAFPQDEVWDMARTLSVRRMR